ncbi:unnamed protein product, partial [Rotaria sp. Silwood2]
QKKSEEYMAKTQAYKCLGTNDPLPILTKRTNKYLLDLRLAKWNTFDLSDFCNTTFANLNLCFSLLTNLP